MVLFCSTLLILFLTRKATINTLYIPVQYTQAGAGQAGAGQAVKVRQGKSGSAGQAGQVRQGQAYRNKNNLQHMVLP